MNVIRRSLAPIVVLLCVSSAESQTCYPNECIVHPTKREVIACTDTQGCDSSVQVWRADEGRWVCNVMQIGCYVARYCCGAVIPDYPPVPCDTFCAGCQPNAGPKLTADRRGTSVASRQRAARSAVPISKSTSHVGGKASAQ
jgi:hypothetical protein